MPTTPDRPYRVDLLLCGHHFRISQWKLAAAGAAVDVISDTSGELVLR